MRFGRAIERHGRDGPYYLYPVGGAAPVEGRSRAQPPARHPKSPPRVRGRHLPNRFVLGFTRGRAADLASAIRLPLWAVEGFPGVGYRPDANGSDHLSPNPGAWTFAERDGAEQVVGFHLRYCDGRGKKHLTGTHRGLFIPPAWRTIPGPLFLVEGASDTLALSAAGLAAIGRPANTGGVGELTQLLAGCPSDRAIVVVGENDRRPRTDPESTCGLWPGRTGAYEVATQLAASLDRSVLWSVVPTSHKDSRDWLVTQARGDEAHGRWTQLGVELCQSLLERAVCSSPAWPAITGLKDETKRCESVYRTRLKGKAGGKRDGMRAVAGFPCRCWHCPQCRLRKSNEAAAWFSRCIVQWADPLRLQEDIPRIDHSNSKGSPPIAYPGDYPHGPSQLFACLVGEKEWDSLAEMVRRKRPLDPREIEHVRILVDKSYEEMASMCWELVNNGRRSDFWFMTNSQHKPNRESDRLFVVILALPPSLEPFGRLLRLRSADAALDLLGMAIDAIPTEAPDEDDEEKRLRPISASKGWTDVEAKKLDERPWVREGSTTLPAYLVELLTARLGGESGGHVSPDAQEENVWGDDGIGGDLFSWLFTTLLDPRYTEHRQLDVDIIYVLVREWRKFLTNRGVADGCCVRDSLTQVFTRLPEESHLAQLRRAVEDDEASRDIQLALKEGRIGADVLHWLKELTRKHAVPVPE
jgi:hypothetical protein